jgi:hypothetical protein
MRRARGSSQVPPRGPPTWRSASRRAASSRARVAISARRCAGDFCAATSSALSAASSCASSAASRARRSPMSAARAARSSSKRASSALRSIRASVFCCHVAAAPSLASSCGGGGVPRHQRLRAGSVAVTAAMSRERACALARDSRLSSARLCGLRHALEAVLVVADLHDARVRRRLLLREWQERQCSRATGRKARAARAARAAALRTVRMSDIAAALVDAVLQDGVRRLLNARGRFPTTEF